MIEKCQTGFNEIRKWHFYCDSCKADLGERMIPPVKCPKCGKETVGIVSEKVVQ